MNRSHKIVLKSVTGALVASTLLLSSTTAYAANFPSANTNSMMDAIRNAASQMSGNTAIPGSTQTTATLAESPTEIVTGTTESSAATLTADEANATTIYMTDSNNEVTISEAGTYIVTGNCADGNITVKKNTTGVVLILKDLTLTSTTGATLSINKGAEVKLIIEGTVNLTDAEDPADEESEDAEVADAFDGAAIKAKDGSSVYLTGTGTLNIKASDCKNGIKVGDADNPAFVIDGDLEINIWAANDAINAGYDMTILSGTIRIYAGDDAIHADRILTIGSADGSGPVIEILGCEEGLEGTVVNLFGGEASVTSNDDGVNAANSDGTYSDELDFSINITGGTWTIQAGGDGLDSNGNINITGGTVNITSATVGGEAGIDYDGSCYISDDATVNNQGGISGPDGGGQTGTNTGTNTGFPGSNIGTNPQNPGTAPSQTATESSETASSTESSDTNTETSDSTGISLGEEPTFGWGTGVYSLFWYEDGVRQGTESDPKSFTYDGTVRGREIYDPDSDAWYWLDANADGAKAIGKEVFMPYVYQNEADWDAEEIAANAQASDAGLSDYIQTCITEGTGKWVRYDESGAMLKGWVTITGKLALLYPDQAGNTYYYDTKTGAMVKGQVTIEGTTYYFDEVTGVLVQ